MTCWHVLWNAALRNRSFADSLLEGGGFELSAPQLVQSNTTALNRSSQTELPPDPTIADDPDRAPQHLAVRPALERGELSA